MSEQIKIALLIWLLLVKLLAVSVKYYFFWVHWNVVVLSYKTTFFSYPVSQGWLGQMHSATSFWFDHRNQLAHIPLIGRCQEQSRTIRSAGYSSAPHSQTADGAKPHVHKLKLNRPTPLRRRLCLIYAGDTHAGNDTYARKLRTQEYKIF